ncbi:MAG: DUF2232 domain-containing protein [Bdellovibrionales bacterium]
MKKSWTSFSIMVFAGYALTLLSLFWGAPFIRVLRARYGALIFWLTGIVFSLAMANFWFVGASVWITIGLFSELEARGVRWFLNGFLSLLAGTGVLAAGILQKLEQLNLDTTAKLAEAVKAFINERTLLTIPAEFDFEGLVYQLPSLAIIAVVLTLAHGLIFEKSVYRWFRVPRERYAAKVRLLEFQLPDAFVWTAMVAFLGSTLEWKYQWIGTNILNVCVALFFFQGLAVLESFFKALRVGIFVRALGYFLFVFQLFIVLAFVGFIDFWIGFRNRFRKIPTSGQDNKNVRLS